LVQQEPSLVSEGIGGMNLMTLVFVIFLDEPACDMTGTHKMIRMAISTDR